MRGVLEFSTYISLTFPHCVFSNVSSNRLPKCMHNHIGYICVTFLHCEFLKVFSTCLHEQMHNNIGCICLTFLHCAFSNASSNCLPQWMQSHIGYIYLTFVHCAFLPNASPVHSHTRLQSGGPPRYPQGPPGLFRMSSGGTPGAGVAAPGIPI